MVDKQVTGQGLEQVPAWLQAELVARGGRMAWGDFMEICLYHQEFGYYTRGLNFLGEVPRDFVTPPEVSGLFGWCVARWMIGQWQAAGRPQMIEYIEIGGGRGTLLRQVVEALAAEAPALRENLQVVLVENSPVLRELQMDVAQKLNIPCKVAKTISELGVKVGVPTPFRVVIGVEILDAFGIYVYRKRGDLVFRDEVVWDGNGVKMEQVLVAEPVLPADGWQPCEGAVWEVSAGRLALLREIAALGAPALLVDYGYARLPPVGGETVQAVHRHRKMGLLEHLGEADLTAHVNFGEAMAVLGRERCELTDLADFLLRMGVVGLGVEGGLALERQHPDGGNGGAEGLRRLLHPGEMGRLFKVLSFTNKGSGS